MEVKNPTVDQMLMNTVAQASANAKPAKNAEQNDFGSMVNQKRSESEKPETKTQKSEQQKPEERTENAKPAEEQPTDEKYAIAAAMMYQAMPNLRVATVQTEGAGTADVPQMQQLTPNAVLMTEPKQVIETPVEQAMDVIPTQARAEAPHTEIELPRITETVTTEETSDEDNAEAAQTMQEAPLFERVEAPVVKVAEAPHPIPLEAENGIEQLGNELGLVVNSADANRVEVTLTPEHLGKLTVEITRSNDGTLNVVLHTTTDRAANLLEKGVDGLRQMLSTSSQREVQVQVRGSEETQQQFLNPDGQSGQENRQQQQNRRRDEQRNTQDFMQQLRLGLVDVDDRI